MKKGKVFVGICSLLLVSSFMVTGCSPKQDMPAKSGVEFESMMNQLMTSTEAWPELGQGDKIKAIETVINLYRMKENVAVLKPASFYAQRIDESVATNPDMKKVNLPAVLRLIAIMEYDYYNGQDKEELAKKLLGEKMYEANKERYRAEAQR